MRDDSRLAATQAASPFSSIKRREPRRGEMRVRGQMHPDDDRCCENAGHVDLKELCTESCSHQSAFFAQSVNGADVQRSAAHSEAARCLGRSRQARSSLPVLFLLGAVSMVQLHSASAYLIKSHLYWERVGAFPHYLTEPPGQQGGAWPKSSLCYNGPSCAKNTPDYRCNPDCGNPNIALKNDGAYPKAYLIRFVSIDFDLDSNSC
jgi:hypothetical protein